MKTKTINIYTFDELSESAKEKAREWYRDGALDYDWWDFIYEDADNVAKLLGIEISRKGSKGQTLEIWFHGFYCQGDGSSFAGSYSYAKGAPIKIREHAPQDTELHRIADQLQALQRRHFYRLCAEITSYRDTSIRVEVYNSENRYADIPDEQELTDLLNDFNAWIFRQLETEYEYLMSDETVDESIQANEYEFTEEGEIQ